MGRRWWSIRAPAVEGGVWGGSGERPPCRVGVDGPVSEVAESGAEVVVPRGWGGGKERAWGVADVIHDGSFGRVLVETNNQAAAETVVRKAEVVEVDEWEGPSCRGRCYDRAGEVSEGG